MSGLLIGCARVSADERDLAAQRNALASLGVPSERVYVDYGLTAIHRDRPCLREALTACRANDTLVVTKLDRLARSLSGARNIVDVLIRREVTLNLGGSGHEPIAPVASCRRSSPAAGCALASRRSPSGCRCPSKFMWRSADFRRRSRRPRIFVVAEPLTNVAKHARQRATGIGRVEAGMLRVRVRDDGVGGARPGGHGLVGPPRPLAVLTGTPRIENAADGGTLVAADLPLPG